jgi:uncharacterized protein
MPLAAVPRVLVLARAPVPRRCKTRLIPALGPAGAAALHRRLVRRTLATARAAGAGIELWCTPGSDHGFFHACRRDFGLRLRRQPAGDLGRRMALALLARRPALLVGTDCPGLTAGDLRAAWRALARHDCVLQPSTDAGYVLIGARRFERRALAGIAWSSGRELAQTRRRFAALGLDWGELRALPDLDTPPDYAAARRRGFRPSDSAEVRQERGRRPRRRPKVIPSTASSSAA